MPNFDESKIERILSTSFIDEEVDGNLVTVYIRLRVRLKDGSIVSVKKIEVRDFFEGDVKSYHYES